MASPYTDFMLSFARRAQEVNQLEQESLRGGEGIAPGLPIDRLAKFAERPLYTQRTLAGAWGGLATSASQQMRARARDLERLVAHQRLVAALCRDIGDLRRAAARIPRPGDDPSWPQERRRLGREAKQHGIPQKRINVALDYLGAYDARNDAQVLAAAAEASRNRLEIVAEREIAALMGARLAGAVAAFNRAATRGSAIEFPARAVAEARTSLTRSERSLRQALGRGDAFLAQRQALALQQLASEGLLSQTVQGLAANALERHGNGRPSARSFADGLALADLARAQLRAMALGMFVTWISGWAGAGGSWDAWVKAASDDRPFASKYRWPRTRELGSLASRPRRADGSLVTVEGTVGEVHVRHKHGGRKVISTLTVQAGGHALNASLPFVKVDSGGIVPGAWCRLAGIWRTSSKDTLGEPALELDRLSYRELGKESWEDWATNAVAPMFTAVPHGLAAAWTWELGPDGAGNPLRYGIWARREGRGQRAR